eukprot:jgi/Phyca11/18173/fgenesh1_pg.PHYCAscaffold_34_\
MSITACPNVAQILLRGAELTLELVNCPFESILRSCQSAVGVVSLGQFVTSSLVVVDFTDQLGLKSITCSHRLLQSLLQISIMTYEVITMLAKLDERRRKLGGLAKLIRQIRDAMFGGTQLLLEVGVVHLELLEGTFPF